MYRSRVAGLYSSRYNHGSDAIKKGKPSLKHDSAHSLTASPQPMLTFPAPPGCRGEAVWNGRHFLVDGQPVAVLSYEAGTSGWTDELSAFHEDISGGNHYIEVASREHALSRLERWLPKQAAPLIMDIGCSSGFLLRDLRRRFPRAIVAGADYVRGPLEKLARTMPDVPLLQLNLVQCPLPDDSLDAAVLLNVLEHIEQDFLAAQQVYRILKPGGIAVIELPAGPHLYDVYDKQLLHHRRYRMADLAAMLERAGFRILERSHLGFFLYPGFWWVKRRNQKYLPADDETQRRIVESNISEFSDGRLMHAVMRAEAKLRDWIPYPWGIRCLVTCQKPG
jgi:SAM-dependent methyltransferase